jgi:hypothetical protein
MVWCGMDELAERLREHARRLDELGESTVMGHIRPETCKQVSEDLGKAADRLDSVPVTDATECKQVSQEQHNRNITVNPDATGQWFIYEYTIPADMNDGDTVTIGPRKPD